MSSRADQKFKQYFHIFMVVWILVANVTLHAIGFQYGWTIFANNALFFLLPGKNYRYKLAEVLLGALVGITLCWLLVLCMRWLTPGLGGFFAHALPLAAVLTLLICGHSYAPLVLNNVGFIYLIACGINGELFMAHVPAYLLTTLLGGLLINGVCILMMRPIRHLADKHSPIPRKPPLPRDNANRSSSISNVRKR